MRSPPLKNGKKGIGKHRQENDRKTHIIYNCKNILDAADGTDEAPNPEDYTGGGDEVHHKA